MYICFVILHPSWWIILLVRFFQDIAHIKFEPVLFQVFYKKVIETKYSPEELCDNNVMCDIVLFDDFLKSILIFTLILLLILFSDQCFEYILSNESFNVWITPFIRRYPVHCFRSSFEFVFVFIFASFSFNISKARLCHFDENIFCGKTKVSWSHSLIREMVCLNSTRSVKIPLLYTILQNVEKFDSKYFQLYIIILF